jgi:3-oxoacyl-[acyl-carrier-protein] synthase II
VTTACAAGAQAIIDGMRCIQLHEADIMVVGGAEACISPLAVASFARLRALSTRFSPSEASRPFDKQRDGFVMAEGAAILVLEEEEHALRRNAKILARLSGYGMTGDAHHTTAPDPHGRGAQRAMRMAMRQAKLEPDGIQYINAHATSTPMGDEIEGQAIHDVFFDTTTSHRTTPLWVSSTKGSTGHLLGAAGALEAAFCVQALIDQTIPPCCNLNEVDDNCSWGFELAQEPKMAELHAVMSNSFGFGGTNACLIFQRDDDVCT